MNAESTLTTIEQMVEMYRSSLAVEQNENVKREMGEEFIRNIGNKCVKFLQHAEMKKPQQDAARRGHESANEGAIR